MSHKTLGIIGKTCSGKSTLAKHLALLASEQGIRHDFFDADASAHQLYREHPAVIAGISALFPDTYRASPTPEIDTHALARHFAEDPTHQRAIESIVYPALTSCMLDRRRILQDHPPPHCCCWMHRHFSRPGGSNIVMHYCL